MPSPDLNNHSGEVDASLSKFTIKTDGDEDAFLFICSVVFMILNSQEAEELEALIPGAKEIYVRATESDDWKGQIKVTPSFPGMSIELAHAGSGLSLIKGCAEVEYLLYRASKKAVTLTANIRVGGQSAAVAGNLCKGLRGAISFIWQASQQPLFSTKGGKAKQSIIPKVGQIIAGRDQSGLSIFGQVVEVNDTDGDALVSDFGEDHQVRFVDVQSAWQVNTGAEDFTSLIKSFKDRCKKRDLMPSWEALTQATGEAFGQGSTPGDGQHNLTKPIISRAVEILAAAVEAAKTAETATEAPAADNVVPIRAVAVGRA